MALLLAVYAGCQGAPAERPAEPEAAAAGPAAAPAVAAAPPRQERPSAANAPSAANGTPPAPGAELAARAGAGAEGAAKAGAGDEGARENDGPREAVTPVRVVAEGQLGPGKNTLFIDIAPPEGAKLTLESPLNVRGSGGIGLEFPRRLSGPLSSHPMPLRLPIDVADGATGPARLELTYYWCTEGNEAACRRERASLDVVLDLSGSGAGGEAHLSYRARDTS